MRSLGVIAGLVCAATGSIACPRTLSAAEDCPYTAYVSQSDVYVRSGPGKNYYPTEKLAKGDAVEVYRHDPGGWYAVRPRGFVCKGPGLALEAPAPNVTRGLPPPPDLTRALPYRYARARSENVPLYARAPSPTDQLAAEPDLKKTLARGEDKALLGAAANDVPLDARSVPTGPINRHSHIAVVGTAQKRLCPPYTART